MKPAVIRNVLQSVIFFLEYDKYFDLSDESGNDLELFLTELNRWRAIIKLDPLVLDKTIPTSTGGQKCRFAVAKAKAKTEVEVVETLEPLVETLEPAVLVEPVNDKVYFKKITRTAFADLLKDHFNSDAVAKAGREDDTPVTNYFIDDVLVGSWAKATGWHSIS